MKNKLGTIYIILTVLFTSVTVGQTSDDFFNDTSPKAFWRFFDPAGDVTLNMTGTNAEFQIPSGSDHDLWTGVANRAPRLLQSVSNSDFGTEVKFESVPGVQYQLQGIIVQESDTKFLRFGTYSNGSSRFVFKAFIDGGSATSTVNTSIGSAVATYLRVERTGNNWTYSYSTDGVNYINVTSFTQVITVTEVGFYGGNGGSNPAYTASADYFWNLADTGFEDTDVPGVTPPTITVWYGDTQTFGSIGNPQQWINILGNVSDANGIGSMSYTLNAGSSNSLNFGPDGKRLVNNGDFNIEIDKADLLVGANTVEITATDGLGASSTKNVTINYTSGNVWPLPYTVDWDAITNIEDVNQVANIVDGLWELTPQGIHTVQTGYDRLIAAGDVSWSSSMEVEVPITVHSASGGSGVGFALGWQGHTGSASPRLDWPLEAIGWVRNPAGSPYLEILTYPGTGHGTQGVTFNLNTTYILKIRSEDAGSGNSFFQVKLWEDGTTEPTNYMLDATIPSRNGSVLIITHQADVTWGNMQITPIASNQTPQFTSTPVTNTTVGDLYTYNITASDANPGDNLTITSNIIPGWLGLVDNGNGTAVLSGTPTNGDLGLNNVELQVEDQLGASSTQSFTISVQPSGGAVLQSDHFCTDGVLENFWLIYDPYTESGMPSGGISTVDLNNSNLVIDVPGGFDHNHWSGSSNLAPRVLQFTQDVDFEVDAKFLSVPSQQYQLQGITAQQDNDTFLRFEIFHDGSAVHIFAAYIDGGSATAMHNSTLPSVPVHLRVNRTGNNWTFDYSFDGSTWNTAASFNNSITITQVGLHAGNTGGSPPPFTALVDYFHVTGDPLQNCKFLTLNSPNGGETWNVGDTETITWSSLNVNNIKIELSTNNGGGWIELESSYDASLGSYSVTVPNSPSNQCLVRITDTGDNSLFDVSDNTFTIELVITNPTIVIGSANTYAGTTVTLPIELMSVPGFEMNQILQAKIHYDPAKLSFLFGNSSSGSLFNLNGWTGVYYTIYPGTVEILASGYNPITTSGNLFDLTFQIIAGTAGTADVTGLTAEWTVDLYNHPLVIQNGQVVYSNPPAVSAERGDATLNFIVDVYDALAVVYHIVGLVPLSGQAFINADVDFDNDVDINDYIAIVLYVYLHDWNYPFTPVPSSASVAFDDDQSTNQELIEVPVMLSNSENVQSVQLSVDFEPESLEFHSFKSSNQPNTFADAFEYETGKVNIAVISDRGIENSTVLGSLVLKRKDSSIINESEIATAYSLNKEGFKNGPTLFVGASGVTGVDNNEDLIVDAFELFQNYPNPFNPTTSIRFALAKPSNVSLKIFDTLGKEVRELVRGTLGAGIFEVEWDGANNYGTKVSSGTYIYRIIADSYTDAKTMILLK